MALSSEHVRFTSGIDSYCGRMISYVNVMVDVTICIIGSLRFDDAPVYDDAARNY